MVKHGLLDTNDLLLSKGQKDVKDFLIFESETSVVYPFAVAPEDVTFAQVAQIIDAASAGSWHAGFNVTTDDIYTACEKVLGINPALVI